MLLGRDAEYTRVMALLERARDGASAALVIRGDPGIGKSALLEAVVAAADGMTVLRARGVESESELAFAGLADLLRPVVEALDALPGPQRAALVGALALGPPAPGARFTMYVATLSLLAAVAEGSPLLAVVDDAPWLDAPSREALVFAARRLQAEGVVLLLAARTGELVGSEAAGVPELLLRGLDRAASAELLARAPGAAIAPHVARRLFDTIGGNPLALLELAAELTAAQRAGAEPLEEPPPVGASIERAFARRLAAVQEPVRRALVVAAASESGALDEISAALATLGLDAVALEEAERAGLVTIAARGLAFRHPLLRSVAYWALPAPERRAAHRALAAAAAGERRAWHLSAAATGPDEEVAAALAAAADAARARAAPAAAAGAAERAARLTPIAQTRARRLLEAAGDLARVGLPERANALLNEALELAPDAVLRADVQHMRALIEARGGGAAAAARLLVTEAERVEGVDAARAAMMLMAAVQPCFEAGENAPGLAIARRGMALAEPAGLPAMPTGLPLAMALLLSNERREARPLLIGAADWLGRADDPWALGPVLVFGIAQAFIWMEELDRARGLLIGAIEHARAAGALGLLPYGLLVLCELEFRAGRWADALAAGAEAARLGEETGQPNDRAFALATLARVEAAAGQEARCRDHIAQALALIERLGAEIVRAYTGAALGLLELGLGHSEQGIEALEPVAAFLAERPAGDPCVLLWPPDLVEAYVRRGRQDDAQAVLAGFERAARHSDSRWALAATARCHGLLAETPDFETHFHDALTRHEMPFEIARTQLCLGERRRRAGRRVEARASLRAALTGFDRLGARPWAERARSELRASGQRIRRGSPHATERLTPQELQVALTIARGLTNREAAARLFLSPKTIEFHLRNIYRKLGIRSRTELVRIVLSGNPPS